jgi:predicted Zn-dependent protease
VTKLKPDDPKAWYNLGVVCKKQGRHDDAIAAFEQAVELKPDYPEVYVIYRKDGKCHKATPAYRRWAELNHPDDSDLWHSLGWSYNIQGKYADAAEAYRRVVELKPNDPNAWFHLGGAYVDQGKCPESLDVLDHLRTLDPALADKLADSLSSTGIRPIEDQQHKKRKVRVLIGNSQPAISEVILDIIAYSGNGQFELVPTTTERAEQVLEYARSQEFDLSIVILNNLSYPPEFNRPAYSSTAHWADEFTDMASQFVAQLKQTCATPIIAMAGEPRDLLLWEKATRAGAANFFLLPFDVGDFQAALKKCLNSANSIRL